MSTGSSKKSLDDEQLVLLAKSGDSSALTELINKYSDFILKKARSFKYINGLDNDDLHQEGMIGFVSAVYSYDSARGVKFDTYFKTVITRKMISALRKIGINEKDPLHLYISIDEQELLEVSDPSPEDFLLFREKLDEVNRYADANLSSTELRVYKLCILGFISSEISDILDMDIKSVDNTIQRIRRKLRKFKNDY